MTRVPISYGDLADALRAKKVEDNVAIYIVKRLLYAKLVTEQVDTVRYPSIRRKFRAELKFYCQDCLGEYDQETVPNSNRLKRGRVEQRQNESGLRHSEVLGVVEPSGTVTLGRDRFQYKEEGQTAWLMDQYRFNTINYKGTASGSTIAVMWDTYICPAR